MTLVQEFVSRLLPREEVRTRRVERYVCDEYYIFDSPQS